MAEVVDDSVVGCSHRNHVGQVFRGHLDLNPKQHSDQLPNAVA